MAGNNSHTMESVEGTYGQAIFELAEQSGQLDEVANEMQQIGELWASNEQFAWLLSSQMLSTSERNSVIENLFGNRTSKILCRFLLVANQRNRLDRLRGIIRAFARLMDEHRGLIVVDAFVAQRMDDAAAKTTADRLSVALNRRVVLHQYVDPQMLGGLKLRVGDRLIDGSVATQLRRIKNKLISAGQEQTRHTLMRE